MIKTAIIGASGYIGRYLVESYRRGFADCIGTSHSSETAGLTPFDIRSPDLDSLRLEESGHEAVLIAAAKPNIGYCEQHPVEAHAVNVAGTLDLVRRISRTSLKTIFLSSDYVFEGTTGSYGDASATHPTTEYGRHKASVEGEIPSLTDNYLILRLSKIYGQEKRDGTLLDEMANVLSDGHEVSAAADQYFSPTLVGDVVDVVHAVQERGLSGVMNLCSPKGISRYEIAMALVEALQVDPALVKKINLHDIPAMAGRPLNTTMRCSRLEKEIAPTFLPLERAIETVAESWRRA